MFPISSDGGLSQPKSKNMGLNHNNACYHAPQFKRRCLRSPVVFLLFAKMILQGTVQGGEGEADRKRDGKIISQNGQG